MKNKLVFVVAAVLIIVPILPGQIRGDFYPAVDPLGMSTEDRAYPLDSIGASLNRRPKIVWLILGGLAGNLAGAIGLGFAGSLIRYSGEGLVSPGTIVGVPVGSIFGSALGVCLAGNTRYWRGKFGSALQGSILGLLSACLVSVVFPDTFQMLGFVYFAVLPPVGAAVLFNSTLERRSFGLQDALFGFSGGRLRLGVPNVQVRPVFIPGLSVKPELQFSVRVFSVKL